MKAPPELDFSCRFNKHGINGISPKVRKAIKLITPIFHG
jgi:hypothetical protein